jgi:predicted RNA polymerase sigma factor
MGYGSEQSGQEMLRELVGEEALHLSQQVLELAQREAEATASQEEPEEGTGYFY